MTGSFSQPQARCQEPKISLPRAEMISSPPQPWSSESRALKNPLLSSLTSWFPITYISSSTQHEIPNMVGCVLALPKKQALKYSTGTW